MKIRDLNNKRILIIGYGKEAKATHDFLHRYAPHSVVAIADRKTGDEYLLHQNEYDLAIRSPGVLPRDIHIPYTTATNVFFANTVGITIGITGTKGKSTTASLVYDILTRAGMRAYLVGNIGTPLLSAYAHDSAQTYYVCELSSYQLEDIRYSPNISLVINLFPEHMDHHGSVERYMQAKLNIIAHASEKNYFFYHPSYPVLADAARRTKARSVPIQIALPFDNHAIPLAGRHNRDNVCAAYAIASHLGIPHDIIWDAVENFTPLPHRLEYIGTFKKIRFYDDAISTTPESTIAAIQSVPDIQTIFLGGQDRGYDFSGLSEVIIRYGIPNFVFFPDSGKIILELLEKRKAPIRHKVSTTSMDEAVRFAYEHTPKGSACLLSCASPSYSLWANFEEKGDQFQRVVRSYGTLEKNI